MSPIINDRPRANIDSEDWLERLQVMGAKIAEAHEQAHAIRGMIYSSSGPGKTVLAASIMKYLVPKGKLILSIDTSAGFESWRNHPGLGDGILVLPFTTMEDLFAVAKAIKEGISPWNQIGGIILDEGSKMSMKDNLRIHEARAAGAFPNVKKPDTLSPGWDDYMFGLTRWRKMTDMLFSIRDLHVIVVAHQSENKNNKGEISWIYPSFAPATVKDIKEPLHFVAYMTATPTMGPRVPGQAQIAQYTRRLQMHPSLMIDAKCRINIPYLEINADELVGYIVKWLGSDQKENAEPITQIEPTTPIEPTLDTTITDLLIADDTILQPTI